MNLLWITENYPPSRGGMAQSCDRIVYGLREQGLIIHVIHFTNRKEAFQTEKLERGSYTAIPVHQNEAHTVNLCWSFLKNSGLNIDKCIAFGGYLPVIGAPIISSWLSIPLITLLRGNDFDTAIFTPRRRQILFDCLERSEAIGCVTKDMMIRLKSLKPGLKLFYTPNGIRLDEWKLMKSEIDFSKKWKSDYAEKKLVIAIFGHLKDKKGLSVLLSAIQSSDTLKKGSLLLLAGELEESVVSQLEADNVSFHRLPFLDRYELMKYYGCADLLVIPSYYDGMPNVMLEAGALGIPVIGSDTGGIHDVLYPELKNFLFQPGNSDGLREKLIEFQGMEKDQRTEKGGWLQEIIKREYNHARELEHLSNLILSAYETKFIV